MRKTAIALILLLSNYCYGSEMFVREESADSSGTYLAEDVDIIPIFLVEVFGAPGEGDGLRVSGIYTFLSNNGIVFTIHDYKSTTVWSTDEGLPTPKQFWSSHEPEELSVGSKGKSATEFVNWLMREQEKWKRQNQ